ncbi:MAG TPA: hypothetical protein GX526_03970 [Thermoanaerobacterales bacterium]|nr:hypothetical protein [Thermoanaerobacterales bacterium]
MKRHMAVFYIILIIVLNLILYGCNVNNFNPGEPQINDMEPVSGGRITLGVEGNIKTINPVLVSLDGEKEISNIIFKGLVKYDKNLNIVPDLAKNWTVSDDGLEWTFSLQDDLKWSDGSPVKSEDVVFTFKQILDKELDSPARDKLQNLASFKALDDSRVIFKLFQPDAFFLNELTIGIVPSHIYSDEIEVDEFMELELGNGPFKVKKWDTVLKEIILEPNEKYYGEVPYVDEIVFKIFPDKESQKSAFKAGEIDAVEVPNEDSPTYQHMDNVEVYQFPNMYYEFIGLNLKKDIFKDIKVRQALMYGIDRNKIQKDILLDKGVTINSPIPPYSWAHNDNLESYFYQPQKALSLLKEAGWEISETDGFLYNTRLGTGENAKFKFKLLVNEENNTRIRVAEMIKQNLESLGIFVEIVEKPWDEVRKHMETKNFDGIFLAWQLDMSPDIQFAFHSNEINHGYNFVSYFNSEIDEITLEARRAVDLNTRKRLLFKGQEIINSELPYLFLYTKDKMLAVKSHINGITPSPNEFLWNVEDWWTDKH